MAALRLRKSVLGLAVLAGLGFAFAGAAAAFAVVRATAVAPVSATVTIPPAEVFDPFAPTRTPTVDDSAGNVFITKISRPPIRDPFRPPPRSSYTP